MPQITSISDSVNISESASHLRPLSKELQDLSIKELNEVPDRLKSDIEIIRRWADGKSHIHLKDDQWLVAYLRSCSFDFDLVKKKLDLLYTLKPEIPEFFSNRDPFLPEIQELLKMGVCLPLPKLSDPTAPRVILCRFEGSDPSKHKVEDGMKLASMFAEILMYEDDNCVISGAHILIDNKGITLKHLFKFPPKLVKNVFRSFVDAYPNKPRGCHIINAPRISHIIVNMIKYLFHSKILDMLEYYNSSNMDKLFQYVPLSIYPKEYGGEGPSIEELIVEWKQKVESYREWFLEEEQHLVKKEPSKCVNGCRIYPNAEKSSNKI